MKHAEAQAKAPPLLTAIGRWIGTVSMTLNIAGTALIFVVMALVNADVIGRTAFGLPISGVPEIVSLSSAV